MKIIEEYEPEAKTMRRKDLKIGDLFRYGCGNVFMAIMCDGKSVDVCQRSGKTFWPTIKATVRLYEGELHIKERV